MSSYSEGQTHQLMEALQAKGFTAEHVTKLGQYDRLVDIRLVLDGVAQIVLVQAPVQKEEVPLDTIIRVNRSVRPAYPDWAVKVMNPELENTGPAEYDLATMSLWLHDRQKSGVTTGKVIYDHLKEHHMLASCGSLQDAQQIQKKGVAVFQKIFGNNRVYFWKSVVRDRVGRGLSVPCLCVDGGGVVLHWLWLGGGWDDDRPAVRFASN